MTICHFPSLFSDGIIICGGKNMGKDIGGVIKKLRIDNNLTQGELAGKLYVSRELVCRWECGSRYPGIDVLTEMSKLFGVRLEALMIVDAKVIGDLDRCIPKWMNAAQAIKSVNDFLRTLNEEDRDVFVLRYFKFRSTKELSRAVGKSEGTVRNRLTGLRKNLATYLEECRNEKE